MPRQSYGKQEYSAQASAPMKKVDYNQKYSAPTSASALMPSNNQYGQQQNSAPAPATMKQQTYGQY